MNNNTKIQERKDCKTCKKNLPFTDFYKNKRRRDGRESECKRCQVKRAQRNRKIRYKKNPELLEKDRERERIRMAENRKCPEFRKRDIKKKRQYYQDNKDKISEYNKRYTRSKRGREIKRIVAQRRYARKKNTIATFTLEQWKSCLDYFNHSCAYCGSKRNLQQEHFVPVSKGGEYTITNIIPACENCNYNKRDKDFFIWYKERDYYCLKRKRKILKYLGYEDKTQQIALF